LPKRRIVERTFSWLGQNRRMSKDYERLPESSGARNVASQGTEATLFGLFRPYILAKFTLGALDKPLFRQFHDGVLRSSPQ
jgi:hypothetical protein